MIKFVYLVWLSLITFLGVDCNVISTTTGLIKGKLVYDDVFDVFYNAYQGIPYAEPPVGDLRFQPPVPKKPWPGVLDALEPGCACPQVPMMHVLKEMSEDCLFLNIFSPLNKSSELLPVLVYIHPGDFKVGSGDPNVLCGPQIIVKNDIILVSLNYRLGALGFLCLQIEEATCNAGVKDVLLALKWTKKNIAQFGGNPNKITIQGHSAGAAIAHVLLLTEQTTGLFQQAILLGGSVTSPRFIQRNPSDVALQLCVELGLKSRNPKTLLKQLKRVDVSSLVRALENIIERNPRKGFYIYTPFAISIESENPTAIIKEEPWLLIKRGIKQNIPIIVGFNEQEGLEMQPILRKNPARIITRLNRNFDLAIPSDIDYPKGSILRKKLALAIKNFYFGDEDVSVATIQQYYNLVTDISFGYNIDSWIKLHKQRTDSAPVYYCIFAFDGELNMFKIAEKITYPGAAHIDDLGYTFVTKFTKPLFPNIDIRSQRVLNVRVKFLSNFLKYGNPTPCTSSKGFIWAEAGVNRSHIISYGEPINVPHPPYETRFNFWCDCYQQYYEFIEAYY